MAKSKDSPSSVNELTVPGDGQTLRIHDKVGDRTDIREPSDDSEYDAQTQRLGTQRLREIMVSTQEGDEERTRVVGSPRRRQRSVLSRGHEEAQDAMDDPPAGWLVIVDGPGRGNVLTIRYGRNAIGRDPGERISISFGDNQISRRAHASVIYDSRSRTFYVQQGSGANLIYLDDEVVLAPRKIPEFAHLLIGETTLRFVPLCGESFDWLEATPS